MFKTITTLFYFTILVGFSQDWSGVPIPADPGVGNAWELQSNVSDDFNYSAPASSKGSTFLSKWDDWYHNAWSGPGLTTWSRDHSLVEGGVLKLIASRYLDNRVKAGVIHSNVMVQYPVYIEAKIKIMNSVLANGAWLLSPDDTQEIDFMEGYGAALCGNCPSGSQNQSWYAQRMHMSHHVFIRSPFADWQPNEFSSGPGNPATNPTWIRRDDGAGNIYWKDSYHRYGVYWKDPWNLYYYIDGVQFTKKEGKAQIDPLFYTNAVNPGNNTNDTRTGLNKAMDIIFSVEDQDWRSNNAITPTDAELANASNHTFFVDWIRVYKPAAIASVDEWFSQNLKVNPNPFNNKIQLNADVVLNDVEVYTIEGVKLLSINNINKRSQTITTTNLATGLYIIKIVSDTGLVAIKKLIKN